MLEYWSGPRNDYKFPKSAAWEFKTDTDLYEFVKVMIWLSILLPTILVEELSEEYCAGTNSDDVSF